MKKNSKIVEILRKYFKNRREIAFAFLYGSHARGNATRQSDVDVAVYFEPKTRYPLEYEEEVYYPTEDQIWSDLDSILKKESELLVMNRVPATISASAIRGVPILVRNKNLYIEFMEAVTRESEDFMDFVISAYDKRKGHGKRN